MALYQICRTAGFGGKFFQGLSTAYSGPQFDVGIIDLAVQGAGSDATLITKLILGGYAYNIAGTTLGPMLSRWGIFLADVTSAVQFWMTLGPGTASFQPQQPFGGSGIGAAQGSEFANGSNNTAVTNLPPLLSNNSAAGVNPKCIAEGFLVYNTSPVMMDFPDDPDDPGALVIPRGSACQFLITGATGAPAQGAATAAIAWPAVTILGGPPNPRNRQLARVDTGGLPQASFQTRN